MLSTTKQPKPMKTITTLLFVVAAAFSFAAKTTEAAEPAPQPELPPIEIKLTTLGMVKVNTALGVGRIEEVLAAFKKNGLDVNFESPKIRDIEVYFIKCEATVPVKTIEINMALDHAGFRPAIIQEAMSVDNVNIPTVAGKAVSVLGTSMPAAKSESVYFGCTYEAVSSPKGAQLSIWIKHPGVWGKDLILAAIRQP